MIVNMLIKVYYYIKAFLLQLKMNIADYLPKNTVLIRTTTIYPSTTDDNGYCSDRNAH